VYLLIRTISISITIILTEATRSDNLFYP